MIIIFQFLEKTKGKKIPFLFKLLNNIPLNEDELIYNGTLDLWRTNLTSLPDNLTVNGHLDLNFNLTSLPNNLKVNGYLDINSAKISELPEDLYVRGNLYCYGTPLSERIRKDVTLLTKYQTQVKGTIDYGGKHLSILRKN